MNIDLVNRVCEKLVEIIGEEICDLDDEDQAAVLAKLCFEFELRMEDEDDIDDEE
jgi:hypothetical protein